MSLHYEIMQLTCKATSYYSDRYRQEVYLLGHQDARHKAAELALKADARIAQLESAIRHCPGGKEMTHQPTTSDLLDVARAQAWERAKGELKSIAFTYYKDDRFSRFEELLSTFIKTIEDEGICE